MAETELRESIRNLLKDLKGLEPLKELFWSELNYDRVNQALPRYSWSDTAKNAIAEDPLLFASGGENNNFHIIYSRLASEKLLYTKERPVVSSLLRDHLYSLFIFSNESQDLWHFLNVKYDKKPDKRRLFRRITIGRDERLRTATERIELLDLALISPDLFGLSPLVIQERHDEAFDVEKVTKQFYKSYEEVFKEFNKDLESQTEDKVWAHDYALQFLNRVMFIYFIQRKRWLGNDPEFLEIFWKSYKQSGQPKDTFFDKWLKVLFFEAFNNNFNYGYRHFPEDIKIILSSAPYLNGGLFVENKLDRNPDFEINDFRFESIFEFFQKYNFTIAEDSPFDKEVAVDPEMIGKVYESLVNVSEDIKERGEAGIFYTPRTEIDLMCRLSLVDNLANHLGEGHKNLLYELVFAFDEEEKQAADKALADAQLWTSFYEYIKDITILDPACGSGSFLVGMLYILDDLRKRANRQHGKTEDPFERKKEIIGNNLYGVDVKDWACHVAELRLWLTLIIDYEASPEELHIRKEPLLPYFTFKIRPGDSLVQEVGGINFAHIHESREITPTLKTKISNLKTEKLRFYLSDKEREFKTENQVKQAEKNLFREILETKKHNLKQEISKLQIKIDSDQGDQVDIYGTVEAKSKQMELQSAEWEKEIDKHKLEIEKIDNSLSALNSKEIVPFVWDISFVEIFKGEKEGFDIVIGNPPYVRQENIADPIIAREYVTPENKREYKAKLAGSIKQVHQEYFNRKPSSFKLDAKSDLYIYFYFHGLSLLNRLGSFCFITSNSWLDVGYGKNLQEFLLKQCHVKVIIDNQVRRSFKEADVNTIIVLFSKPQEKYEWGFDKTSRFIMLKVPFEHILHPVIFEEIEEAFERKSTEEYRIHPINQKSLFEGGCEILTEETVESMDDGRQTSTGPLIKVAKYIGNKWGGKYLRAPDIYWTILEKGKGKFVRLGDVADVKPGCYSGINDFFYLSNDMVRYWGIENNCLIPLIRTSRDITKQFINSTEIKHFVFYCPFEKREMRNKGLFASLEYIEWGEKQVTRERQKTKAGIPWSHTETVRKRKPGWWSISENNIESTKNFLLYVINQRFLAPWSNNLLVSDRCFHRIMVTQDIHLPLALSLNSSVSFLFISLYGRGNLGQGALKYETKDAKNLLIFDPNLLQTIEIIPLLNKFGCRKVLPISQELYEDDRKELDNLIFDELKLTQMERDSIYESIIYLVTKRLDKAISL